MIAILDYRVGNVRSVEKALQRAAAERGSLKGLPPVSVVLTADRDVALSATGVVLPGVGAFGECITNLRSAGFEPMIREVIARGIPLLGICVGMQMLFDVSEEMGEWQGLGILPGRVVRFRGDLRVPQIGWNQLHFVRADPLVAQVNEGSYTYFVHSYYCHAAEPKDVIATTDYGIPYPSVVGRGRVWGIQCHPEKSQSVGLCILGNFLALAEEGGA
ncbi:MAG: imidazole glycerol phosphate synthase subunit HisH [Anaerolineae bacterium]|nr:imidazole glycerol phosphate synthase subunit HisH [Anaerolineae bacterium]